MATRRNLDDLDSSIKSRASAVFADDTVLGPSKSFSDIVRQTPPKPLSLEMKALLCLVGLIVVMLFFAALIRVQKGRRQPRPVPVPSQGSALDRFEMRESGRRAATGAAG